MEIGNVFKDMIMGTIMNSRSLELTGRLSEVNVIYMQPRNDQFHLQNTILCCRFY